MLQQDDIDLQSPTTAYAVSYAIGRTAIGADGTAVPRTFEAAPFGMRLSFPSPSEPEATTNIYFAVRTETTNKKILVSFPKCLRADDFAIVDFAAETPSHTFTISYEAIKGIEPVLCLAAATRADVDKHKATILTRTPIGALIAYHSARCLHLRVLNEWKDRVPRHFPSPFAPADRFKCEVLRPLTFFRLREQNDRVNGPLGPPIKHALAALCTQGLIDGPQLSAIATALGDELPKLKGRLLSTPTGQRTLFRGALGPRVLYNQNPLTTSISVDFDLRTLATGRRRGAAVSSATYEDAGPGESSEASSVDEAERAGALDLSADAGTLFEKRIRHCADNLFYRFPAQQEGPADV
jgi:hypothetical protein